MELFQIPGRYLRGVAALLAEPRLLGLWLVPYLSAAGAMLLFLILSFVYYSEITASFLGDGSGFWHALLGVGVFLLTLACSAIFSLLLATVIGSIFIERFIRELFKIHGIEAPESANWKEEVWVLLRSLKDLLWRLAFMIVLGSIILVTSWIPFLSLAAFCLGAFVIGFDLLDLPLEILRWRFGARYRLIMQHKGATFGLGIISSLFLLIPFAGLLFLPFSYWTAVDSLAVWLKSSPQPFGDRAKGSIIEKS